KGRYKDAGSYIDARFIPPFQGLTRGDLLYPGFRFATPWAIEYRPFRAEMIDHYERRQYAPQIRY
ncbi:MAG: hypothetical protein KAR13_13085, partial [Desulfobulbaceae bacterium]|nr:hypothetical protein [Desulfobulbaceae bacterium]